MNRCMDYLPSVDVNGNRWQRCHTLPENHANPPNCKKMQTQPSGLCSCGRAGCQHPKELLQTSSTLTNASKQTRLF